MPGPTSNASPRGSELHGHFHPVGARLADGRAHDAQRTAAISVQALHILVVEDIVAVDGPTPGALRRRPADPHIGAFARLADVRIGWTSPQDRWSWAVYGNNVFDNQYVKGLNTYGRGPLGVVGATISEPRTYGVEVAVKF